MWALGAYVIARWSDSKGSRKPFLLAFLVIFSACSILSGLAPSFRRRTDGASMPESCEQHGLSCDIVPHARASRVIEMLVVQPFLSQQRLLLLPNSHVFANFAG